MIPLLTLAVLAAPPSLDVPADVARLASPRWADREAATLRIEARLKVDADAFRPVFAALRHRDPEVRARAGRILLDAGRCERCGGLGYTGWGDANYPNISECGGGCGGYGSAWLKLADAIARSEGRPAWTP